MTDEEIQEIKVDTNSPLAKLVLSFENTQIWHDKFRALSAQAEQLAAGMESEAPLGWSSKNHFLISPVLIYKNVAVRLRIDAEKPFNGTGNHLNSEVAVLNDDLQPSLWKSICLTGHNPSGLLGVFVHWDTVCRLGIPKARKMGMVTQGWIDRLIKGNSCSRSLLTDARRYADRYTKLNTELAELEAVAVALNIGIKEVKGDGHKDRGGRYFNSWFENDYCQCCNSHARTPSRNWPWTQYRHIMTKKHYRNAILYLIKQRRTQGVEDID